MAISTLAAPSQAMRYWLYAVALLAGADEERGASWLLTSVPLPAKAGNDTRQSRKSDTRKQVHAIVWQDQQGEVQAQCYPTAAAARAAWATFNPAKMERTV